MEVNNECIERQKTYLCICGQDFGVNQFCIQCDFCKEWFHGSCVGLQEFEAEEIDKFYCKSCLNANTGLTVVPKAVTNNWRHNRTDPQPHGKPTQSGTSHFVTQLKTKKFSDAKTDETVIRRMRGQQLTFKELLLSGFDVPILVESKDGLELTVPSDFSYKNILDYYSSDYLLDVIDVRRQLNIKMKAQDFVNQMNIESEKRVNIYNCISLEVSNSLLSTSIRAPNIVTKLSWVDNFWPNVESKPQVSKYCLISMKDSFTDFHIDFGGTSVWYHVLNGEKIFYIIKPTKQNLEKYEKWMALDHSCDHFFPDMLAPDQCYRLNLYSGQTLLIPTGWIHAVLTPRDSLVFGGNFLHSLNIELQLKIREMEERMKTPFKFQFPFFEMTHWYAAPNVQKLLEDSLKQKPPKHLVSGVTALISQLKLWHKKSKDFQNQNEFQMSTLAPKGFNCFKLIKDLNSTLKKAIRKLEGQPIVKKRSKSYKDFDLETNEQNVSLSMIGITSDVNKKTWTKDGNNQTQLERDGELVIDQTSKVTQKVRTQSTDSESKGSLKLKLSISGAKEILGTNQSDGNQFDSNSKSDTTSASKKLKNKRKKESTDPELDDEIDDIVKGRPQDNDYIYLDLETPNDEEVKTKQKTTTKDESWAPKAKVTIRATPKAPRLPRDEAKRAVVETSIANAAAKMENTPQPKRQYIRKKQKVCPTVSPKLDSPLVINDSLAPNSVESPSSVKSGQPIASSTSQANSPSVRATNKPKKGQKTPKQRLHKIICQKKRMNF